MSALASPEWIEVEVLQRKEEACGIISLDLRATGDKALPAFTAGAHIDVLTSSGAIRQYSLWNDPDERHRYCLGVQLTEDSRGGSKSLHQEMHVGTKLTVSEPRNLFSLVSESKLVKLVAGGIGITPLLSMAHVLEREQRDYELHVCVRNSERLAFQEQLQKLQGKVYLHLSQEADADCPAFLPSRDLGNYQADYYIYTCGPDGFMKFICDSAEKLGWPADSVRLEHFAGGQFTEGDAFTVEARKSGITVDVESDQSIAEALQAAGVSVPLSCEQGICGMCLTNVIEGVPEHRDMYMTDAEKTVNNRITICCSRSKSALLVLDI